MEEQVIHFAGAPEEIFKDLSVSYELLLGGYAIVKGPVEAFAELRMRPGVLFMERPITMECEAIYNAVSDKNRICLNNGQIGKGRGVLMAYLDSGIDYRHPEFLTEGGKSRIYKIYDLSQNPPVEYDKEIIDEALLLPREEGDALVRIKDLSGHGTHVAAIGSGNTGVAPECEILMVKLGIGLDDHSYSTVFMRGIDYCVRMAKRLNRPMVINISYGNAYGAHNGSSIVEQYLNEVMNYAKLSIVAGAGNEGDAKGHFHGVMDSDVPVVAELAVSRLQPGFSFQIWKRFEDEMQIVIQAPGGEERVLSLYEKGSVFRMGKDRIRITVIGPSPVQIYQEILVEMLPGEAFLQEGIWKIKSMRQSVREREMELDIWLPVKTRLAALTGFLNSSPETTVTIPGTAERVITVGAYDTRYEQIPAFSGRGFNWLTKKVKPELVAPGAGVISAAVGGGYTEKTGTSMATPFVSGAAALLMEWGIVNGRDPFLYADKLKAYLIRGATPVSGITRYPDKRAGWGKLCIDRSLFEY